MGGGISLEPGERGVSKFTVNVATDILDRKHNVRFVFKRGRPSMEELISVCRWHYDREAQAHSARGTFEIDQIQSYTRDKRWRDMTDVQFMTNGGQLYVFQPEDRTGREPAQSAIPEPYGEAVVTSLHPTVIDYSTDFKLRAIFSSVDKTEKKYVLLGEVHSLLSQCGTQWDYNAVEKWFARLNTRGTGRVSYQQWARFAADFPQLLDLLFEKPRSRSFSPSSVRASKVDTSLIVATWNRLSGGRDYFTKDDARALGYFDDEGLLMGRIDWSHWWSLCHNNPTLLHDVSRRCLAKKDTTQEVEHAWQELSSSGLIHPADHPHLAHLPSTPLSWSAWWDLCHSQPSILRSPSSVWSDLAQGKPYILRRDIRDALLRAGLPWDQYTVGDLFDAMDTDHTGRINYDEWARFANRNPQTITQLEERLHHSSATPSVHPVDRSTESHPIWSNLAHGKPYILRRDIRDAVMRAGLPWDQYTVGDLFDAMDTDHTGRINFDEWVRFADRNPRAVAQLDSNHFASTSKTVFESTLGGTHSGGHSRDGSGRAVWDDLAKGKPYILRRDIRDALIRAGLPWDQYTVGDLFDAMDTDHTGRINYDEWVRFADRHSTIVSKLDANPYHSTSTSYAPPPPPSPSRTGYRDTGHSRDMSHTRDATRVSPRRVPDRSMHSGGMWADLSHGKPYILRRDLREALIKAGLPWDQYTVGDLFDAMDTDHTGRINYDEWVRFTERNPQILSRLEERPRHVATTPMARSSGKSHPMWSSLSQGKPYILRRDIRDAVMRAGLPWDQYTVGDLFDAMDTDHTGRINFDEWVRFVDRNPRVAAQLTDNGAHTPNMSMGRTAFESTLGSVHGSGYPRDGPGHSVWNTLAKGKPYILRRDIRDALLRAGLPWDQYTVGDLFDAMDTDHTGRINYDEWVRFADRNPRVVSQLQTRSVPSSTRSYTSSHRDSEHGRQDQRAWTELSQGKPYIVRRDLRDAVVRAGLPWDQYTVGDLFDAMDTNHNGRINYDEWVRFADRNPRMIAKLLPTTSTTSYRHDEGREADEIWRYMQGSSGSVSYKSLRRVLNRAFVPYDDPRVRAYFNLSDPYLDRQLATSEWHHFCQREPSLLSTISQAIF